MTYTAKVLFEKMAQHDTWSEGCTGNPWTVNTDTFYVNFTDTDDLKQKLADWVSNHYDVSEDNFLKHVNNECENDRFDYNQSECEDGYYETITEENPDGYLADYMFWVTSVMKKVDYNF